MPSPKQKIKIPDSVATLIRKMHPKLKRKIRAGLEEISADPHSGKALREEPAGLMTFRVSSFRIVYRIAKGPVVEIVAIGPRKRIYEETYRLVKKDT
ncbi:MAG: type II toxin-antitoxin system RelE/ParE family toxin [Proteobacteria bacterium]|nr:type II toxin-antitoxin system RelE/ParE family toxin [Pseudomonadota bacterium]